MSGKPVLVVLLGPPGAGKGTQGALLADQSGCFHVSTGDLFRKAVESGSPAGLRAETFLTSGELVPDELVNELVEEFLSANPHGSFCLDGFPRTLLQAVSFDSFLAPLGRAVGAALLISVQDEIALKRVTQRGRGDDRDETARIRLEVYHRHTEPLVDYYRQRGLLVVIDGSGDVDSVAKEVFESYQGIV